MSPSELSEKQANRRSPARAVSDGCRVLALEGHGDLIWGHVSVRDPDGRGTWMKSSGWGFEEVGPEQVVRIDRDGQSLEGDGRTHIEYPIHTEILEARPDVGAVVHTHSRHAVAFAATGEALRPVSHEACLFVPPDIARFTRTGDLIRTQQLGAEVADVLGERNGLLLLHHGLVTVGGNVGEAVVTAIILDHACRTQLLAMASGRELSWSTDEEARAKREHCYGAPLLQGAWRYLLRVAARRRDDVSAGSGEGS